MRSTDTVRVISLDGTTQGVRYNKVKKGRAVTKAERPTYDRACAAMLAKRVESWHVYDDGWTFTVAGTETEAMTLPEAAAFLDRAELPAPDDLFYRLVA